MSEQMARFVHKVMSPIKRCVANMLVRGIVSVLDNTHGFQMVQATLLHQEVSDNMERMENYGFTGFAPLGSECFIGFMNGNRDHPMVINVASRDARKAALAALAAKTDLEMQPGDVLIYTENENFLVLRNESGNLILNSPETIRFQGKEIELFATDKIKLDVNGRGWDYLPTKTDTWEIGSVAGSTNPITPPEHPPDPSQ